MKWLPVDLTSFLWGAATAAVGFFWTGFLGEAGKDIWCLIKKAISGDSARASPTFWSFGRKFRIQAVHQYVPSNDSSGYDSYQHSRPDQWNKFVMVESSLCKLRHRVKPINSDDVLAVVISRNGREQERVIYFNK